MDDALYRVSCGSAQDLTDGLGRRWQADVLLSDGAPWGAVGGDTVLRERDLPIHSTHMAEVLRSERFNLERYEFAVEPGSYLVQVYAAETFEGGARPSRAFDVAVNDAVVAQDFSPYRTAGGFALAALVEAPCAAVGGRIRVAFGGKGRMANAIAVLPPRAGSSGVRVAAAEDLHPPAPPPIAPGARRTVRILFIGNSGTFFWDIPETVACLVNRGQPGVCIEADALVSGGKLFGWHWQREEVRAALAGGTYDYVVLQDGTAGAIDQPEHMALYGGKLIEAARAGGAEPVLYAYFGPQAAPAEHWNLAASRYLELGSRHDVAVVPTGTALRRAMLERPEVNYHNPDRHHSGMHGAFAFAACFYRVLTGGSAAGHPYPAVLADQVRIDPAMARFLARVADEACDLLGERARLGRGPLRERSGAEG